MANLIDSKEFCAPLAMLSGLDSFVLVATRQSLLSLSLTEAKRSVENVLFGALALCVKCPPPPSIFLVTKFLFMATILQLKVARRRLFEKVSLERCIV